MQLFLGLALVIVATRVAGLVLRRARQPPVIGEMLAGVLPGPSLGGRLFPDASRQIFTPDTLAAFATIGQIGVSLFIFLVAVDVDLRPLRKQSGAVIAVSHSSVVVPFALGVAAAAFLYPDLAGPRVPFLAF